MDRKSKINKYIAIYYYITNITKSHVTKCILL